MKTDTVTTINQFGKLALHIGDPDFYTVMIELAAELVSSEMNIIMLYSRHTTPIYIKCDTVPENVVDMYNSGYYRFDPFYHYWRESGEPGVITAREASTDQTITNDHFSTFLPSAGINDELGILLPTIGNAAIGLFLERSTYFKETEKNKISQLYPLLHGLHMAHQKFLLSTNEEQTECANHLHMGCQAYKIYDRNRVSLFENEAWQEKCIQCRGLNDRASSLVCNTDENTLLTELGELHIEQLAIDFPLAPGGWICSLDQGDHALPPISFRDAIKGFLIDQLTPREREIIELILAGYPSSKIAEKLGISVGNVKNHRKRIYLKMDITTEREIFLQFLEHLSK